MSAMSPGQRISPALQSSVTFKDISDTDVLDSLNSLKQVIQSCFGPSGKLKIIHSQSAGHATVTSSSGRLLNSLSISKPILKFIIASVNSHIVKYKDGGLYSLLLTLNLIENGIKTELKFPLISELFAYFGNETLSFISELKTRRSTSELSLDSMLHLVRGIIQTKRACYNTQTNLDILCKLLLETFLNCVPSETDNCDGFSEILKHGIEGLDVSESKLYTGVLLPFTHDFISDSHHFNKSHKVVVLTASLSGDSDEFIDAEYELVNLQNSCVTSAVMQMWLEACQQFVKNGISVVLCQRVVHPIIQQFFHENDILVIDRIGSTATRSILNLTRSIPVKFVKGQRMEQCYGVLSSIELVTLNRKKFCHLKNASNSSVQTLVLCNWSEQSLEELKYVSDVVQHVLQMSICRSDMLPGGGCLETLIASKFHNKIYPKREEIATKYGCSTSQLLTAMKHFKQGIFRTIIGLTDRPMTEHWTDYKYHHCWLDDKLTCQCGALSIDDVKDFKNIREIIDLKCGYSFNSENVTFNNMKVYDLADVKVSGLQIAFNTASTMLRIGCTIYDQN